MKDLLLTSEGDLLVNAAGDISLTDSVRQAIRIRLRWFWREWRLGPDFGVPYWEEALIKNAGREKVRGILREQILLVDEVENVKILDFHINNRTRSAVFRYEAQTAEEIFQEEVKLDA